MNIVSLGSSQTLNSSQWRLTLQGLGRETLLSLTFGSHSIDSKAQELEASLPWIFRDSNNPLELVFDLSRMSELNKFGFAISSEVSGYFSWVLDGLNSDETWSAGSQDLRAGDTGTVIEFELVSGEWLLTALAPKNTSKTFSQQASESSNVPKPVKLLIDASPSAINKLHSFSIIQIIEELNRMMNTQTSKGLSISYLGQFEASVTSDQQLDNQHRNSLARISQLEERPEPLRKVVFSEVALLARGSRLLVISDGSFIVSGELATLAESKDVTVELLVVGSPAVLAELRDSPNFKMALLPESLDTDRLHEICFFSID